MWQDGLLCLKHRTPRELPQSERNQEMAKAWLLSAKLGFVQVLQINLLKPGVKQSLSRGSHQGGCYWSLFSLSWPVCLEPQRRTSSLCGCWLFLQQDGRSHGVGALLFAPTYPSSEIGAWDMVAALHALSLSKRGSECILTDRGR